MNKGMIRVSWLIIFSLCFLPLMGQRQIEEINRGLIAVRTGSNSVLVSWRWLGNEPEEMAFNVYRDGNKLNDAPVAQSTNYLDETSENGTYTVKPVLNGLEGDASESAVVWSTNYMEIALQQPAGGTTPANESYTYNANDASVGDLDGDGVYDIVLKWEPSNAKDNSQSGYTGQVIVDAYKLDGTLLWRIDLGKNIRAGAHYTQFLVYDFDGDGKSELVCKTAPGTKDGLGSFLSAGVAASDNDAADYRNSGGYVLSGPEYLTIFNGESGAEMATVNYTPPRGNVSDWGDSYGNRVDRFLAAVAYLDGEKPSIVMTRGYYTRSVLSAWDWDGTTLSQRWIFDSDAPGNSAYSGQGNHNLSVADVDGDGKDEIIFGSCTIDNDGTGLYSTGLGHGDALHVTDHDPSRPGLEVFMPHEHSGKGISYRDAATGDIIWQKKALGDIGRGVAGDISADHPGSEFWAAGMGMYNVKGEKISNTTPSMNFLIWWDGDLLRELLDGTSITKYQGGTLLSAGGCSSNNGTKATPALQADLLGDWREEVIFRTSDNSKLRIYTTPYETSHRFRTLMHDPVYRLAVAWQNVSYNQPPHVGFYLGHDMNTPPKAPIVQSDLKWDGTSGLLWQTASGENWVNNLGEAVVYQDGPEVLFSLSGNNSGDIEIIGDLAPGKVTVNAPFNYVLGGSGSMTGSMQLIKSGVGSLTMASDHSYSGGTLVDNGLLEVNGVLNNSAVLVTADGSLTGVGTIGSGVSLGDNAQFYIGGQSNAGLTTVGSHLILDDHSRLIFDLSAQPAIGNDKLVVEGDLVLESNMVKLTVNTLEGPLSSGTYSLMSITGSLTGDIGLLEVEGLLGYPYELELVGNELLLHVETPRTATRLVWDGSGVNTWDLMETAGWLANGVASSFAPGDTVVFNDAGNSDVNLSGNVPIGDMYFESANSYTFSGDGVISGEGGLIVSGTGTLNMTKYNEYVGPTVIKSGTLSVPFLNYGGQPSSLGAAGIEEANLVIDGGVLLFSGAESNTNRGMTFGENGAEIEVLNSNSKLMLEGKTLGGTLVKSGPGRLILEGAKAHAKTVLRGGRISLFGDVASPGSSLVIESGTFDSMDDMGSYNTMTWAIEVPEGGSGTLNLDSRGTYTGKLTGSGTLYVNIPNVRSDLNGDWSAFAGTLEFSSSYGDDVPLRLNNSKGLPNAHVQINGSVFASNESGNSLAFGALSGFGTLSGAESYQVGAKGTDSEFSGNISAGSLTKVGAGTFKLSTPNAYTGYTLVTDGLLLVDNTNGSATGTGGVTVRESGGIGGTGIVEGALYVESGGALYGGYHNSSSKMKVTGKVTMKAGASYHTKLNGLFLSTSHVIAEGGFEAAGDLFVELTGGSYRAGQGFKIIDSGSITGSFESITPAAPSDGLYWDTSELYTLGILKTTDQATSIRNLRNNNQLKIYPNPVQDVLEIQLAEVGGEMVVVEIVDVSGQLVVSQMFGSQRSIELNVSQLNQGVYFLRVKTNNQVLTQKITKL